MQIYSRFFLKGLLFCSLLSSCGNENDSSNNLAPNSSDKKTEVISDNSNKNLKKADEQSTPQDKVIVDDEEELVLNIEVTQIKDKEGSVCVAAFDNADTFLDLDSALFVQCEPIDTENPSSKLIKITYLSLETEYALAMFVDANENRQLDTRKFAGFDVPAEGYGFSQNPGLKIGSPSFNETSFIFNSNNETLRIDSRYLF